MKKENLRRFNIQAFAEPPADGEGDKPPVITQADLDKARAEANKFKIANDKLSHENAEYKKTQKEKLTNEEQLKLAQEEKDNEIKELKQNLNNEKISKSLVSYNFSEDESKSFLESLNSEDPVERATGVLKVISIKIDAAVTKAKEEFNLSSQTPPLNNGDKKVPSQLDVMFDKTRNFNKTKK